MYDSGNNEGRTSTRLCPNQQRKFKKAKVTEFSICFHYSLHFRLNPCFSFSYTLYIGMCSTAAQVCIHHRKPHEQQCLFVTPQMSIYYKSMHFILYAAKEAHITHIKVRMLTNFLSCQSKSTYVLVTKRHCITLQSERVLLHQLRAFMFTNANLIEYFCLVWHVWCLTESLRKWFGVLFYEPAGASLHWCLTAT